MEVWNVRRYLLLLNGDARIHAKFRDHLRTQHPNTHTHKHTHTAHVRTHARAHTRTRFRIISLYKCEPLPRTRTTTPDPLPPFVLGKGVRDLCPSRLSALFSATLSQSLPCALAVSHAPAPARKFPSSARLLPPLPLPSSPFSDCPYPLRLPCTVLLACLCPSSRCTCEWRVMPLPRIWLNFFSPTTERIAMTIGVKGPFAAILPMFKSRAPVFRSEVCQRRRKGGETLTESVA